MNGCGCTQPAPDVIDMTGCELHPVYCEALDPTTGVGCQHAPGHRSDFHSFLVSWPNERAS